MTSFNGTNITYDGIGNPLPYYNGTAYTFTWEGRQLLSAVTGGKTYTFTYNSEGIRTSKNALGVVTNYYLNGSQIVAEETSGNVTVYLYDASGSPIGMQYHKATDAEDVWEVYWYEKNLQGDIIAVYSSNATKLVSYSYDAWGYFKTTYHNGGASTKAAKNPFRYRGYYYDLDLGLYYLNSRYYDCNTGRFINADKFVSTGQGFTGYNMFAYCNNNPISYVDSMGTIAKALVVAGGGFLILAALCIIASSQPAEQVPSASPAPPLSLPTKEDLLMPLAFLGALLSMLGLKEEAKEEVTTAPPPDKETTYYHVTTSENAASIMAGGVMYGSTGEGGYIYAWKKCPNSKAIKDAGTRGNVVISFTTSAAFEPDPAFYEMPYVNSFLPVRSVFPGPIKVSNVLIIGD